MILRGKCKGSNQNWTRVAQVYPRGVCQQLAMAQLRFSCPGVACAGGSTARIGEASNPGPASRTRLPRAGDLSDVALLEPATLALQDSAWRHFEQWLMQELCQEDIDSLRACPQLLALLLAECGYVAYRSGLPLHVFRQLLARCQREIFGLRSCLSVAWDVVSRWEFLFLNLCCTLCLGWRLGWAGIDSGWSLCSLFMLLPGQASS